MTRRNETFWLITGLLSVVGIYGFWLFFQWFGYSGDPGVDSESARFNAYVSLVLALFCLAGVIGLSILHVQKKRRDI